MVALLAESPVATLLVSAMIGAGILWTLLLSYRRHYDTLEDILSFTVVFILTFMIMLKRHLGRAQTAARGVAHNVSQAVLEVILTYLEQLRDPEATARGDEL
ncbi:hypothetical protein NMY22_g16094 [Coprinellus aureogranulatus]|nr:hypothetical protein NMY22_g16094 [Coprinellus aureogranulatus]